VIVQSQYQTSPELPPQHLAGIPSPVTCHKMDKSPAPALIHQHIHIPTTLAFLPQWSVGYDSNLNEVFQPNLFCIVPPFKWHSDINGFVRQSLEIVERKINQVTRTMTKNKHLKMKRSMSSCKPAIINFVMHKQGNQDERTKQALSVSKFW
jgi:hypothetical protein